MGPQCDIAEQGQVTQYKTGNNVTTVRTFDAQTGRLTAATATRDGQAAGNILAHAYTYDSLGNLTTRADNTPGIGTSESFSYDAVNRLTIASIMGGGLTSAQMTEVQYDEIGNITYKSDVGRYWYDAQRPSRMVNVTLDTPASAQVPLSGTRQLSYAFDNTDTGAQTVNGVTVGNGNLRYTVQQDTVNGIHTVRSESYTSFNMPSQIVYGNFVDSTTSTADRTLTFTYGPEHQRVKQVIALSGSGTSSYQSGTVYYMNGIDSLGLSYEKAILTSGITEHKYYVSAGSQVFAIYVSRTGTLGSIPATTTSYIHQDRLGSVGAIADETGTVKERFAYDPWGKRRYVNGTADVLDAIVGNGTRRGYTMHEHLDEVGVIHMNARIYDPLVGRFMSADSMIPNPTDLKSFNRYAYVENNPLINIDPSGHALYCQCGGKQIWDSVMAHEVSGLELENNAFSRDDMIAAAYAQAVGAENGVVADVSRSATGGWSISINDLTPAGYAAIAASQPAGPLQSTGTAAASSDSSTSGVSNATAANGSGGGAAIGDTGTVPQPSAANAGVAPAGVNTSQMGGPPATVSPGSGSTLITIAYTDTPVGMGTSHALVIATDMQTGQQYATRAGPSAGAGQGGLASGPLGFVYAQAGPFDETFRDPPAAIRAYQDVGTVNLSVEQVAQTMQEFAGATNAARVAYTGFEVNSNSYAFTYVQSLGFQRPEPMQGIWAPGWSSGTPARGLSYLGLNF